MHLATVCARTFKGKQHLLAPGLSRCKSVTTIDVPPAAVSQPPAQELEPTFMSRIATTAEVTVSKIVPAGMGWQSASLLAENWGFECTQLGFYAITGVGDALGVGFGHTLYYIGKKMLYDKSIDLTAQSHAALMLGSAAFFSGGAWQPTVAFLQDLGVSFSGTALGTTMMCGSMFFGGLRASRHVYSPMFSGIEKATDENLKADAQLSLSVGGATGAFVGCDVSFGDANFLRPVVGVEEGMSDLTGIGRAGLSTAIGFSTFQMGQNIVVPKGKCWVD